MAGNFSKTTLVGNVVRDPDTRFVGANNAKVSKYTIAVNRYLSGGKSETDYHDVIAWDKQADLVEKMVKKGSSVFVEATPVQRSYVAKDGSKRRAHENIQRAIQMLDSAPRNGSTNGSAEHHIDDESGFPDTASEEEMIPF